MIVHTTKKPGFTPGEEALLTTLANQAAVAIQRARLIDQLRVKITQLEHAQAELVKKERLDREMDFHNNAVGRRLGEFHAKQRSMIVQSLTGFFLFGICKNALVSGELRVVDRSAKLWRLIPSDSPNVV